MKKKIIISIAVFAAALSSCTKDETSGTVFFGSSESAFDVYILKEKYDRRDSTVLHRYSRERLATSEGEHDYYCWALMGGFQAFFDVYADGYTRVTIGSDRPCTMKAVTVGGKTAPIEVSRIDDRRCSVVYRRHDGKFETGYILVSFEGGVSKLVSVNSFNRIPAYVEDYPSSVRFAVNDGVPESAVLYGRETAAANAVRVAVSDSIVLTGFIHGLMANYDVRNTVGEIEFGTPHGGVVSGTELPAPLIACGKITIKPKAAGLVYVPVMCRKPDGTFGGDETQYFVLDVK